MTYGNKWEKNPSMCFVQSLDNTELISGVY